MRTIRPWMLVAAYVLGALTFAPLPNLPTTWPDWSWLKPGPSTPPLVVMLHEAQHGPLSSDALGAAQELRAAGRDVRIADDDEVTGLGQTPAWLKPALEQGRTIMGGMSDDQQKDDALILLRGETVVKATKMPATRPEIVQACK